MIADDDSICILSSFPDRNKNVETLDFLTYSNNNQVIIMFESLIDVYNKVAIYLKVGR